jgi:hypothetical protein
MGHPALLSFFVFAQRSIHDLPPMLLFPAREQLVMAEFRGHL